MSSQEKISVAGSGVMGNSIALAAAWAGFDVKLWGTDKSDIKHAKDNLNEKMELLISYGIFDKIEKNRVAHSIAFTNSFEECFKDASFVIEAIPENLELKQNFFKKLDELCPSNTILASNTSGLSATKIAELTNNPDRTVVTHFWLPAHLMPLVEVVRGDHTSETTIERSFDLMKMINKQPILVKKDVLGQVGNRLQYAIFREAQYILEQEIASLEDIDSAIRYSLGRRFGVTGPFMTMDMGGLDTNSSITSYLFQDLSTKKDVFPVMTTLVDKGNYGAKTGKGYYNWTTEWRKKVEREREEELIHWIKKDMNGIN